jgi:hypothetical protein
LLLLVASPGLAGLALDAAHPCPEKAPWTVSAETAAPADHRAGDEHHPGEPAGHHDCKCVGSCQTAPAVRSVDADGILAFAAPVVDLGLRPARSALIPVGRPADLLPPATAPPLI